MVATPTGCNTRRLVWLPHNLAHNKRHAERHRHQLSTRLLPILLLILLALQGGTGLALWAEMETTQRLTGGAYQPVMVEAPTQTVTINGNGASSHAEVAPTLDDKASLTIVMCVVFLGDTARGIFFPTLWTYVKAMGGDRITLGYSVGAFSLGRVMISPYFGGLSTKHGYQRVLMAASGLIAAGALAYALAWNNAALIGAQILMGVGSGTLGVTRAYVADKSTPEQRTYLLAYTTAVQYAGFTCMPFVGGFLSFAFKDSRIPILGNTLVLTSFTAPAFVMMIAALVLLSLLKFVFKDSIPKAKKVTKTAKQVATTTQQSTPLVKEEAAIAYSQLSAAKYLMGAPSDVSLARSSGLSDGDSTDEPWPPAEFGRKNGGDASSGPQGLFVDSDDEEDRAAPTTAEASASDAESGLLAGAAKMNGSNGGSNGYGSLPAEDGEEGKEGAGLEAGQLGGGEEEPVAAAGACCRMPSLPDMLIYGGFLLNMSTKGTIACFETLGAEYAMTHFGMTSAEAGSTFATFGMIGVASLLSMRVICRYFNDVQIVLGGMGVMIVACMMFVLNPEGRSGLPLFLWAVFLMYSVGYPIGHTAVLGLFSKVVGAQPQGALLGWFGSAGSLARIGFPVIAGVISQELGTSKLFMALVGTLSITVGVLFAFRKPYLNCVEITKRRSMSRHTDTPAGATTNGNGSSK